MKRSTFAIRPNRHQQGASLITAVFLITTVAAIGALMARLSSTTAITSAHEILSARALYAAETGVDWAAFQIRTGVNTDCVQASGERSVGTDARFSVAVSCDFDGGPGRRAYRFVSTGAAGGTTGDPRVQREITVQFMP